MLGHLPQEQQDAQLKNMYGMYSDEVLNDMYEDACQWRDWWTCELISDEFDRRSREES